VASVDRLLPWLRRSGWAYVLLAVALASLAWRLAARGPDPTQPAASAPVQVATAAAEGVLVHVAGAVRRPGLYRVDGDARVMRAIRQAGGATARADLARVNLAARVQDGQQIVVPARAPEGAPAGAAPAGPVSLSSATAAELDALDGIGPTLAARIVAWREQNGGFQSVDQLLEVPGIGPTRLEALGGSIAP
jgi:competence protein ComEA